MATLDTELARGSLPLSEYVAQIAGTDVLNPGSLEPIQLGLYGEVGGIMSASKKHVREGDAFPGYRKAAEEEFGDTLWYFTALCRRLGHPLEDIFADGIANGGYKRVGVASDYRLGALAQILVPEGAVNLDLALFDLGRGAADLLGESPARTDLVAFAGYYLKALSGAGLDFSTVVRANIKKTRGAFLAPDPASLIDFDRDFLPEEQLPRQFRIKVSQRASGRTYLQWNDVFIGDPLTDNIADRDGYRFHDVFHFAHAAILHWSPVVRALVKQKRKSRKEFDEEQDCGRAIVVEEGLTAWIFARAKDLNFFEDQHQISFGVLKTIGEFVSGYEVSSCPPKLWEKAILDGYKVFRQMRAAQGGWIVGDRDARTIHFEPLAEPA
ncbi:nucleoside triphosphate pyrophosphohydrolase family protein [Novosphingobium aerophilum]|uniref:nucleoside triphosphate pyrophosphohydrolase family protein n=1 Tax=Novosphingobium aerophilum TaxID=2839843 RepID=UPI003FD424E1